ncbi:hypothetical protein DEJ00_17360 [Curtobacterium sp. MCLR17_039]|uniref:hypothetical protein n=1 Tax=Curtobacterium sp. MCLR17_039 TaxID=2175624 RepID=UPI000DAA1CA5|nr:hypothetical protein [Curtobacterium sp. MCLR17_039]PZE86630.1 hypothetical protein DEJ00_17360 [Curtobacterium sp. MCLR17_039]
MTATSNDEIVSVGPWRLALRGAELADVTFRGTLVLRAIRFVVRDHDWRTADDTVLTRTVDGDDERIRIETSERYDGVEVVRTVLEVTVDDDTLRVAAVGTVTRAFRRNRIGLVVLHPPTLAGQLLTVRHPSGGVTATAFPFWIAPHQPAVDVAGLDWAAGPVALSLDLTGDVFETEDQRNWTDASFKTYSTPLAEPFPVAITPGTTVRQGLTLRATAGGPAGGPGTRSPGAASPARTWRHSTGPLPVPWSRRRRRSSCSRVRHRSLRARTTPTCSAGSRSWSSRPSAPRTSRRCSPRPGGTRVALPWTSGSSPTTRCCCARRSTRCSRAGRWRASGRSTRCRT